VGVERRLGERWGGVWAGRGAEKVGCGCYEWLGDMRGILGCFCGLVLSEYGGENIS
jgi:hypothetical protein